MNITTKEFQNPLQKAHRSKIKFTFDKDSLEPVSQTLKNGQVWSADIAAASSLFWKEDSIIVDIGTHIGTYSTLAASFTKGKVISFEPGKDNFSLLFKNKEINGFDHWEIHNLAASDKDGVLSFCEGGPGAHVYNPGSSTPTVEVKSQALDSILLKESRIDFIKLDVEGWELNVLDGMRGVIERDAPPIVFEVNGFTLKWFNHTPNDLLRKLESEYGYRIFVLQNKLIPINSFEPFPFGVVDCFALKDNHLSVVSQFLTLPLSWNERKRILEQSVQYANEDMASYFEWYRPRINL